MPPGDASDTYYICTRGRERNIPENPGNPEYPDYPDYPPPKIIAFYGFLC